MTSSRRVRLGVACAPSQASDALSERNDWRAHRSPEHVREREREYERLLVSCACERREQLPERGPALLVKQHQVTLLGKQPSEMGMTTPAASESYA